MKCFNTVEKLIVAPALVIALMAGSAMAGPGQHLGGIDHHGSAISDHFASHSEAKLATRYGTDIAPSGMAGDQAASASGDQPELGAIDTEPFEDNTITWDEQYVILH
ncbi:hypothetical protein [Phaeobacter gallaeciensis]|uniref:hypothetical protein n=1 Tax=Phaeobacter gallaeciensis TaxID=60890 RepID=UPI000BBC39F3|nr:hypothetical protein [Phaeobacter gallaeciensis]ATF20713.1 hypothetical protein PhaeoP129_04125 [Phaeobacter gallaeciensis]ATF24822.1 hypothetical protein PhaeoP128_04126 [Phaeobacter gallaeciensis]